MSAVSLCCPCRPVGMVSACQTSCCGAPPARQPRCVPSSMSMTAGVEVWHPHCTTCWPCSVQLCMRSPHGLQEASCTWPAHSTMSTPVHLASAAHVPSCPLCLSVPQGLCFLHSQGVLHLDVKPENIYLSAGAWRIGDFGLAVARDREGSMVRQAGRWQGHLFAKCQGLHLAWWVVCPTACWCVTSSTHTLLSD